jgi:archaellum component FlaC
MLEKSHPSWEALQLFQGYEVHHLQKSDQILSEIEEITEKIQTLQQFLSALAKHTEDSARVDWSSDPVKRDLVDKAREAFPGVLEHGVYNWKNGKEIEQLISKINNHINGFLHPQISHKSARLTQAQYENNEVLEIMTNLLKDVKNLIDRVQANLQRAR